MKKLLGTTILLAMIALLNMEQSANAAFFWNSRRVHQEYSCQSNKPCPQQHYMRWD
ncbi:MAG: hypothetical protein KBD36_00660 [Alphaproteobacteria bacterium]|jgi:hypothetical protein|nr:hypothetical protein [Alphaproteobacteria bacterium]MBP9776345.1 hypothetical protein [Alphaproteobacteria bacterium]